MANKHKRRKRRRKRRSPRNGGQNKDEHGSPKRLAMWVGVLTALGFLVDHAEDFYKEVAEPQCALGYTAGAAVGALFTGVFSYQVFKRWGPNWRTLALVSVFLLSYYLINAWVLNAILEERFPGKKHASVVGEMITDPVPIPTPLRLLVQKKPCLQELTILVVNDLNRDGIAGEDEPGIAGIPVSLLALSDEHLSGQEGLTDGNGVFIFKNLPPGGYRVVARQTEEVEKYSFVRNNVEVELRCEQSARAGFTLQEPTITPRPETRIPTEISTFGDQLMPPPFTPRSIQTLVSDPTPVEIGTAMPTPMSTFILAITSTPSLAVTPAPSETGTPAPSSTSTLTPTERLIPRHTPTWAFTSSPTSAATPTSTQTTVATPPSTPTPTLAPTPARTPTPSLGHGTNNLTAQVFIDYRCDSFFQDGLDIPLEDASVTLSFPDGSSETRHTRPFGMAYFSSFDSSHGLTVSVKLPVSYKRRSLGSCINSPTTIQLQPSDFDEGFRSKFVQFRAKLLGGTAGP